MRKWIVAAGALLALAVTGPSLALYEDEEDWLTDDLIEDDYGLYDEDFNWTLADDDADVFGDWYEEAHLDWAGYDDPGEEGWFDW